MARYQGLASQVITGMLAAALLLPGQAAGNEAPPPTDASQTPPARPAKPPAPHRAAKMSTKAREHYRAAWGVDRLRVSRVASGNLIRFDFHVTDPAQAAPLVDKATLPVLYAPRAGVMLSVPVMEKIGALRQTGTLKAGQDYWVTFSNKGNLVASGDRVDVIIGRFHADGLKVD